MQPSDVLKGARELLATPEKWTKGAGARTALGYVASVASSDAFCFCVVGAIAKAAGAERMVPGEALDAHDRALRTLANVVRSSSGLNTLPLGTLDAIAAWNDAPERTIEDVRRMLARAENIARFVEAEAA